MTKYDKFRNVCIFAAPSLKQAFGFTNDDIAAVMGNFGHESDGTATMQERLSEANKKKGYRGGYGWAQWTGPRRTAYEKYCKDHGLSPDSDEANLGFVIFELKGPEKKAVSAVKDAKGLQAKVVAFEQAYERAGAKHYDSRLAWAERALAALPTVVVEAETQHEEEEEGTSMIGAFFLARLKAIVAFFLAGLVTLVIQSIEQGTGFSVPMEWSDWLNAIIGGLVTAVGVERVPNKEVVETKTGKHLRNK